MCSSSTFNGSQVITSSSFSLPPLLFLCLATLPTTLAVGILATMPVNVFGGSFTLRYQQFWLSITRYTPLGRFVDVVKLCFSGMLTCMGVVAVILVIFEPGGSSGEGKIFLGAGAVAEIGGGR